MKLITAAALAASLFVAPLAHADPSCSPGHVFDPLHGICQAGGEFPAPQQTYPQQQYPYASGGSESSGESPSIQREPTPGNPYIQGGPLTGPQDLPSPAQIQPTPGVPYYTVHKSIGPDFICPTLDSQGVNNASLQSIMEYTQKNGSANGKPLPDGVTALVVNQLVQAYCPQYIPQIMSWARGYGH